MKTNDEKPPFLFVNPDARANRDIPNLALAYAATHYGARVVDLNTLPRPPHRFLRHAADTLGISIQSRTFSHAKEIAKQYKEKHPAAKVKSIHGWLDVQCCYPYLDLDAKLEHGEPFSDDYPFPAYELFDSFPLFSGNWRLGLWSYAIMTSQGCPFACTYCVSRKRKWRARSSKNCYLELERAQKKWGIKRFVIIDDCFNVDINRALDFCRLIEPLGLRWSCLNGLRADLFPREMAEAMSSSGCERLNFGIESVDDEVLAKVQKGEDFVTIEKAVDRACKHFPAERITGFFIIGLPGSNYEKDRRAVEWARRKGINALFSYYLPFDEKMQYDSLFFGSGAAPHAASYPAEQQKEAYNLAHSIWKPNWKSRLKKLFVRGMTSLRKPAWKQLPPG